MATLTLAPNYIWFAPNDTTITRSMITEINIVDSYTATGNEAASWDASADKDGSVMCYVNGAVLTIAGNGSGKIYANADSQFLFYGTKTNNFSAVTAINGLDLLDTVNVTTLMGAFNMCISLGGILDVSSWNVSNVTNMSALFQHCVSLETVNVSNWNTGKVTDMTSAFFAKADYGAMQLTSIIGIDNWDMSKVTTLNSMFGNCSNLRKLDVSKWDTSSCTNMSQVFGNCSSIEYLDLSNWNTNTVTTMTKMFVGMNNLKTISLGANFAFVGGETLPVPSVNYIAGVDGNWYNMSSWNAFTSSNIPSNTAAVYTVIPPYITLAPNSTWFSQGGTTKNRSDFTKIYIVNSISEIDFGSSTIVEQWDASVAYTAMTQKPEGYSPVTAYALSDNTLVLAGNGSGKIYANEDSSYLFSYAISAASQTNTLFINVTSIDGLSTLDTSNVTNLRSAFAYCISVNRLELNAWNTSRVTNMGYMFTGHDQIGTMSLMSLDLSDWDVSSCCSFKAMFRYCLQLTSIYLYNWDTSSCTDMSAMFALCPNLLTIDNTNWDVSNVTTMAQMFRQCNSLTALDVSNWDVGNVTTMEQMFYGCRKLLELDVSKWNVSNVTTMKHLFCMDNYDGAKSDLYKLDTSNWDLSSCTDISFMFYGCNGLEAIDVSNWDVSKVTNFDHFLAHSHLVITGVEKWDTSAAVNMHGMFHSFNNTTIDVSNFNTSNVQFFDQMFEYAYELTEINGLENFDTSNGLGFSEMFNECSNLKELNLSSFDTRKAKDGVTCSTNGGKTETMARMFGGMNSLEKITLGENFSFNGDGTTANVNNYAVLPTPNSDYITRADGNWYSFSTGSAYAPSGIPNGVAETYVAFKPATLVPNHTWFSGANYGITRSSITEINIVDSYTPTGNEAASWDASVDQNGGIMCYVNGSVLTIAGNGFGKIYANEDSSYLFSYPISATSETDKLFINVISITGLNLLDTSNTTTLKSAFTYVISVSSLDLNSWDVSKVTNMVRMFRGLSSIGYMSLTDVNINNWDVSNVTDMSFMFQDCPSLQTLDISKWNTSSCTNMMFMFYGCSSIQTLDVSNWDVSKVTTMQSMFCSGTNYGQVKHQLTNLDISNWNTSSCTDMSFMFYGLNGVDTLDVSKWDVSKVTTFDHMMAHSGIVLNGIENWRTPSATNMNAMFHTIGNTTIDVSNFNTSKVQFFCQMFESSGYLTEIKGLENWDTSSGLGFDEMFNYCGNLKELNLSNFDTRKAKDGVTASTNGHLTATMKNMFGGNMSHLEKITLGANFSFNGDGTTANTANHAVLPTPSADYIQGADGNWYSAECVAFIPTAIPSRVAATYYASFDDANEANKSNNTYLIRGNELISLSKAIRTKTGNNELMDLNEMVDTISSMSVVKTISGDGLVNWHDSQYTVFPSVKMFGKTEQQIYSGKNMFDVSRVPVRPNVIHVESDCVIVVNRSANGYTDSTAKLRDLAPNLVAGKQYTFSFETESSCTWIYLTGDGRSWRHGECKTVDEIMLESRVVFYGMSEQKGDPDTMCRISKIQIEEGETITAYEPYTGSSSLPSSQHPVEFMANNAIVQSCGKNLFNPESTDYIARSEYGNRFLPKYENGIYYPPGEAGDSEQVMLCIPVEAGAAYTLSYEVAVGSPSWGNVFVLSGKNNRIAEKSVQLKGGVIPTPYTFTIPDGYEYVGIVPAYNTTRYEVGLKNIQLEKGSVATAYEPYFEGGEATAPNLYAVDGYQDEWDTQTGIGIRRCAVIENYAGEAINTPYISTTGELSEGAMVVYGIPDVPFKTAPMTLICPEGGGQIVQIAGDVDNCPLEVKVV